MFYLSSTRVEFLQTIFQSLDHRFQVNSLLSQKLRVESDLLQERFRSRVVVSSLVLQINFGNFVDARVDVRHEQGDWLPEFLRKNVELLSKDRILK